MTARGRWIAAVLVLAAVAGGAWWHHRADRAALVAEIEDALAAKRVRVVPSASDEVAAEALATGDLYAEAARTRRSKTEPAGFFEEEERALPGDPRPLAEAFVAEGKEALDLVERAAARPACAFPDAMRTHGPTDVLGLVRLVRVRGRLEIARGDLGAAVHTAGVLRSMGRHCPPDSFRNEWGWAAMTDLVPEFAAVDLLGQAAVRPGLDASTAAAVAQGLAGPWAIESWIPDTLDREFHFDRMCLWVLGPDGAAWAEDRNRTSNLGAQWDDIVRGRTPAGRVRLPSAGELREMRAVAAQVSAAARVRDMAAFRPRGPLDAAWDEWKGRDMGLDQLGAPGPSWFRTAVQWEARLAVARAAAAVRVRPMREGGAPAGVEELDPFDGKPLTWIVGPADGWVIRSRCWTGKEPPVELRFPGTGK